MKSILINFLSSMILVFAFISNTNAQTNISGSITANSTWTKANSPYIVTDDVVVEKGIILTIEPGVEVRFVDNKRLEIRAATLNAIGTVSDSIIFTSNSLNPDTASWSGLFFNGKGGVLISVFDFCSIKYANDGILVEIYNNGINIQNSNFVKNITGINGGYFEISNCGFSENKNGIKKALNATSENCKFYNNEIAYNDCYVKANNCHIYSNQIGLYNCDVYMLKNSVIEKNQIGIYTFISGTLHIENCKITKNQKGISIGKKWYNLILNCTIDSNYEVGIELNSVSNSSILNCNINNNNYGLRIIDSLGYISSNANIITGNIIEENTIGFELGTATENIYCNKICNNVTYNLKYSSKLNSNISNNYWCDKDSSIIEKLIFDKNDNDSFGLVSIMPLDTIQCYLCDYIFNDFGTKYPTCSTCNDGEAKANPSNANPPYSYEWNTLPVQTTQTATGLSNGFYTVLITDAVGCSRTDSVYLDNTLNINNELNNLKFTIFPNPSADKIFFKID